MNSSSQSAYLSFLKSKLRSRIDFLEKYATLIPEFVRDKDLRYLKSITLTEATLADLDDILGKVMKIEENVGDSLKNYASENYTVA
jgi:hypothetical protein